MNIFEQPEMNQNSSTVTQQTNNENGQVSVSINSCCFKPSWRLWAISSHVLTTICNPLNLSVQLLYPFHIEHNNDTRPYFYSKEKQIYT